MLDKPTSIDKAVRSPAVLTDEYPKQPFRLDNDSSDTFTLQDGRKLGYAQYGSMTGRPIFHLHGHPGSRLEGAGFEELGLELGARIIAVDRPGVGWSSPHPGRTLLDHPKDLEQLAEYLELEDYRVMGISGGGPYALACAAALPAEKLKRVAIVCGLGPPDIGMSGAGLVHWLGFTVGYQYCPSWALRWFWKQQPVGRLDLTDEQRLELLLKQPVPHEKENDFMKSVWPPLTLRSGKESFSQGFDAVVEDGRLLCMDPGFRVEDIRPELPVDLWYGKFDTFVPPNHGVQIAARLGDRAHLRLVDETHGSIVVNRMKEILEELAKSE